MNVLPDRSTAPFEAEADFARSQLATAGAIFIAVAVAAFIQAVSPKSSFHWLATAQLVITGVVCALHFRHQARLGHLERRFVVPLGVWITVTALVVLAYVGPFTAGAIALCPICYVFGYTRMQKVGTWVLATATFGYSVITLLALGGVFDPAAGPIGITAARTWLAVLGLALVTQAVMIGSFVIARRSRAALSRCFARIESANLEIDRRGAQLEHARWDLDHVVELAQVGHLTGTRMGGYRIGELIGRGGMGEVYRAWATDGGNPIALKVLTPTMADNPAMVERFFREARVSSTLESPHIVRVLDSGWAEGGYPFLAMELLRGRDLAVHLIEEGRMEAESCVQLVDQIASALLVAHNVGIVHRDIKPENIFRANGAEGSRWVVLDFGVSKVKGGSGTLTGGGMIGTPRYMAPEQARGACVDQRADVFSLGAIVYRCLTGRAAFDADDALGALVQVMNEQPVSPAAHVEVHEDVGLLLALALSKDPKRRIPSVATFAVSLADACRGELTDDLRRQARALLSTSPWSEPESEAITIRPGAWPLESGRQRIPTAPLPEMLHEAFREPELLPPPPPPPVRRREDSFAA